MAAELKPHLLLISIDGLRWDYLQRHQPTNLLQLAANSAKVERLLPAYPSKTFPNHLSLVTGLYPEHHGIISNHFYNPTLGRSYSLRDPSAVTDGRFYSGVPIWSLAEQQGLTSAVYFWPGSEAKIADQRPSYYQQYSNRVSHKQRIEQVIRWLSLPEAQRPQFVALYFSAVDSAGHKYGPEHANTGKALRQLDRQLGQLFRALAALPIAVNVVLTSDHGMREVSQMPTLLLDQRWRKWRQLRSAFKVMGSGALVQFYHQGKGDKAADLAKLGKMLAGHRDSQFYLREQIPAGLHFSAHEAIGDAVLLSDSHYLTYSNARSRPKGNHGFDPNQVAAMQTLLLASGPAFDPTQTIARADNVHLYPLMAAVLGLTINTPIDGELHVLAPLLRHKDSPSL
ncbi:ectonucleotide pyrophosphatase/phosphodiesterase [uncultured Ferrimonas sp.]|uniref:alkaline phosphatase family protein n=1 Tax=uncultured Ferrimonas sp. TaxID=432640 RepID=UPI002621D2C5|nr:ectonucleotide pyrophosphatase/phosphodiesterase [uncultured Ferrimonas sp.]